MTMDPASAGAPNLVERVKNILLSPKTEWDKIAAEPAETNKIYIGYVLPLVALAAICGFIGLTLIGYSAFGVTVRVPMMAALTSAILQVVMGVVGIYVLALIVNALAPTFSSQQDTGQAHKLATYSATAGLLAGVLMLLPPLSMLAIIGSIYSLVLLYLGLPRLMKTPEDKRIGYFITIIVVSIVLWLVVGFLVGTVQRAMIGVGGASPFSMGQSQQQQTVEGQMTLPGGGTIDLGELQRQSQAAVQGGAAGGGTAADPMQLQQRLPQALPGGFALTSASSSSAMGAAQAEGVYQNGNARIRLTVMDMGAMGAFAGMAAGMNVQENRQDANGYARTRTVDGRVYNEEVDNSGGSASYGVVGRGVAVTADGSGGVSIDQVRAAVEAVGIQNLESQFGN